MVAGAMKGKSFRPNADAIRFHSGILTGGVMLFRLSWAAALLLASLEAAAGQALELKAEVLSVKNRNIDVQVNYPHTGNAAIDAVLAANARKTVADFRDERPDFKHGDRRHVLDVTYAVERNDGDMLGLRFTTYIDLGGAHGSSAFETFNFEVPSGRRVVFADIVDGDEGLQRVSQLAIAQLTSQLAQPDHVGNADWIRNGAGPDAENFRNVILEPHALRVWFAPYEVASYADGPLMVEIPLSALQDVLKPEWRDGLKLP
jgi:hypothetical protein